MWDLLIRKARFPGEGLNNHSRSAVGNPLALLQRLFIQMTLLWGETLKHLDDYLDTDPEQALVCWA